MQIREGDNVTSFDGKSNIMLTAFKAMLEHSPDLIFVKDINSIYQGGSLSFAKLVGKTSSKELVGKSDFEIFGQELAKRYLEDDRRVIKSGVSIINNVEPVPDQNGRKSYSSTSKFVLRDEDGNTIGLCGVGRDVTSQVELEQELKLKVELQLRAETDGLTGLKNRSGVIRLINECIQGYGKDQMHALLFIDLDFFKMVNDNLGHMYGDKVLREISDKLLELTTDEDIVGRVGGDEFIVMFKNIKSREEIEKRANQIFGAKPFGKISEDSDLCVTCSIGISIYNADDKTFEKLYEEADTAMYVAKRNGKNQIAFSHE